MSLLPTPAQVAQTHLSLTPHHNMITTDVRSPLLTVNLYSHWTKSLRYARPDVQRSEVETWDVPTITEGITSWDTRPVITVHTFIVQRSPVYKTP